MVQFHQDLASLAARNEDFHYHYVTAREMYNLVKAAESGWAGSVDSARDYELVTEAGPRAVSAEIATLESQHSNPVDSPSSTDLRIHSSACGAGPVVWSVS